MDLSQLRKLREQNLQNKKNASLEFKREVTINKHLDFNEKLGDLISNVIIFKTALKNECDLNSQEIRAEIAKKDFTEAGKILKQFYNNELRIHNPNSCKSELDYHYNFWLLYIDYCEFNDSLKNKKVDLETAKSREASLAKRKGEVKTNPFSSIYIEEIKDLDSQHTQLQYHRKQLEEKNDENTNRGCGLILCVIAFIGMLIWFFIGDISFWLVLLVPFIIGIITYFKMRNL